MVKIPRDLVVPGILAIMCALFVLALVPGCSFLYLLISVAYFIWAYCISLYKEEKDKSTVIYCAVYSLAWPAYVLAYILTFINTLDCSKHIPHK